MERLTGLCNKYKVVIVGAGISGISAAARLLSAGISKDDLIVLEASNRIGGRVKTVSFEGYTVDLGAQWVHGEDGNIVYEMAKKSGGLLDDSASDFIRVQCVLSDSTLVDIDLTEQLFHISEQVHESITDKEVGNYGDYFIPRFNDLINKERPNNVYLQKLSDDVKNSYLGWLHQFHNSVECSDSWYETSVTSLVHYRECDGNILTKWNSGGYSSVIQLIYNKFGVDKHTMEDRVSFNKEVVSIDWDNFSSQLTDSKNNSAHHGSNKVTIKCEDNSVYICDKVLVSVSLGVLKRHCHSMFKPSLPYDKLNIIKGLGIGTVDKLFIKFPYKWWPDSCPGFSLLWTDYDIRNTDFIQGDARWAKDIFGFYTVDGADKLLCGWIVGESARNMEHQTDEHVLNICYKLLNKFLRKHYNIPEPDALLRSKWQSDKFIRGSYSFRTVDSDRLGVKHEQLAEPLTNSFGDKVVFFAGEATHPYFYSTVHGAVEAGIKQAENILSHDNLSTNRSKL